MSAGNTSEQGEKSIEKTSRNTYRPRDRRISGSLRGGGGGDGETSKSKEPNVATVTPLFSSSKAAQIRTMTNSGPPVESLEEIEKRTEAQPDWTGLGGYAVSWAAREDTEERRNALQVAFADFFEDSFDETGSAAAVLTKNGITLVGGQTQSGKYYASAIEHSIFGIITTDDLGGGHYGFGLFDPSGSAPDASDSATWRGVMVGAVWDGDRHLLQGDTEITYDFAARTVSTAFTNIVNLDTITAHSTPSVTFPDIDVSEEGTWMFGENGDPKYIRGSFAGSGHEEALGVFWAEEMMGSFGAQRQSR